MYALYFLYDTAENFSIAMKYYVLGLGFMLTLS